MTPQPFDSVRLRPEGPGDEAAVGQLHRTAFGDRGAVVANFLQDLRPSAAVSLVAEDHETQIGHVLCSPSLLDAPRRLVEVQTLSPLAVLPERQGQGIGAALVREAVRLLDGRGVPIVFLEGSPAYYGPLGFTAAAELGFRRPSLRIPEAAFQAVRLAAHEPWMTGTLVYPDIFWRHDVVGLRDPVAE
ncbi:GNAT family N-acetyltransferase [Geodermatophilus sp. SYSU D00700]